MRLLALNCLAALLGLSACAHPPGTASKTAIAADSSPASQKSDLRSAKTEHDFADALTAPLADLNLMRTPIPTILAATQLAPYAQPTEGSSRA